MLLAQSGLFKNLSEEALAMIEALASEKACDAHALVFREGDPAENLYVLMEGIVHLVMREGEDLCFVVDQPGDVFGWSALVEPYRYRACARCIAPAKFVEVPREAVERVLRDHPADAATVFRNLATIVTEKLHDAYRRAVSETDPWR